MSNTSFVFCTSEVGASMLKCTRVCFGGVAFCGIIAVCALDLSEHIHQHLMTVSDPRIVVFVFSDIQGIQNRRGDCRVGSGYGDDVSCEESVRAPAVLGSKSRGHPHAAHFHVCIK